MKETVHILKEDPDAVSGQIKALIGEGAGVLEHVLSLLEEELEAISQLDEDSPENHALSQATMYLGVRFHSAAQAGVLLLMQGRLLPAYSMSRDMIEILALVQYLRIHPKEGKTFISSRSLKQRRRFSCTNVCKNLPKGELYKAEFDLKSALVHPSSVGIAPTVRPALGGIENLYIGPFYQPFATAIALQEQMAYSIEMVWHLRRWYKSTQSWPVDVSQMKLLETATLQYCAQLRNRAQQSDYQLEGTLRLLEGKSLDQLEAFWNKINQG